MIKLILSAPVPAMAVAFEHSFQNTENVEIIPGPFETIPEFDCMVSAANSFGLMDGGVDAAITAYFGPQLQERYSNISSVNIWENSPSAPPLLLKRVTVNIRGWFTPRRCAFR